jgi:stress-induced morphogen
MLITIEAITQTIQQQLSDDAVLQVVDESALHYGHVEKDPKMKVTHVAIILVWERFKGVSLLGRQRMVNTWLADLFKVGLHAVSYTLKSSDEVAPS